MHDLFGYNFRVSFDKKNETTYPTACGGSVSIILKLTVMYILYYQMRDLFNKETEVKTTIRKISLKEHHDKMSN